MQFDTFHWRCLVVVQFIYAPCISTFSKRSEEKGNGISIVMYCDVIGVDCVTYAELSNANYFGFAWLLQPRSSDIIKFPKSADTVFALNGIDNTL